MQERPAADGPHLSGTKLELLRKGDSEDRQERESHGKAKNERDEDDAGHERSCIYVP